MTSTSEAIAEADTLSVVRRIEGSNPSSSASRAETDASGRTAE